MVSSPKSVIDGPMGRVEHSIRAPTGNAWLLTAISIIVTGEVQYEAQKPQVARFFNQPFTDGELAPIVWLFAAMACAGVGWLLTLYLRPGSLVIDSDDGIVQRIRHRLWQTTQVSGAIGDWRIRITYFSENERRAGRFKRLELKSPQHREVLLFTDLSKAEELCLQLEKMGSQFESCEIQLEREAP